MRWSVVGLAELHWKTERSASDFSVGPIVRMCSSLAHSEENGWWPTQDSAWASCWAGPLHCTLEEEANVLYPPLAFFSRAYTGWDGTLLIHRLSYISVWCLTNSTIFPSGSVAQWQRICLQCKSHRKPWFHPWGGSLEEVNIPVCLARISCQRSRLASPDEHSHWNIPQVPPIQHINKDKLFAPIATLLIIIEESACNAGDPSWISGLGRSPGEGNSYPLPYSGLKNSMDCIVHAVTKSLTQLSNFHFH